MKKQYVYTEKFEDGRKIRQTFTSKEELLNFIKLLIIQDDFETFTVKPEHVKENK